ncbi:hypothetical protein THOM_1365 [Trachipleistophora hominis]|uniref:Uncharacterized protein n=1 Tax=Trachipleistophora hominis TaxID=72359 RepID=L7JW62_TRAHO|nr:hypothetical protein THOM_1365 [Trachipleistophora hominis]
MSSSERITELYEGYQGGKKLTSTDIVYLNRILTEKPNMYVRSMLTAFIRQLIIDGEITLTPELLHQIVQGLKFNEYVNVDVAMEYSSYYNDLQDVIFGIFKDNMNLPFVKAEMNRLVENVAFDKMGANLIFVTDASPKNHLLCVLKDLKEDEELITALHTGKNEIQREYLMKVFLGLKKKILESSSRIYMTCVAEINEVLCMSDLDLINVKFELTENHLRYLNALCVNGPCSLQAHSILEKYGVLADAFYAMEQTVETGKMMLPVDLRLLNQVLKILAKVTRVDKCAENKNIELMVGALFSVLPNATKGTLCRILANYDEKDDRKIIISKLTESIGMLYDIYGREDGAYEFVRGFVYFVKRCVCGGERRKRCGAVDDETNEDEERNGGEMVVRSREGVNLGTGGAGAPGWEENFEYDDVVKNAITEDATKVLNTKIVDFVIFVMRTENTEIIRSVLQILLYVDVRFIYDKLMRQQNYLKKALVKDYVINNLLIGIFMDVEMPELRTFDYGLLARMISVPCSEFFQFFRKFDFAVIALFLNEDLLEQIGNNRKEGFSFLLDHSDEMCICRFVERNLSFLVSLENRDVLVLVDRVMDKINVKDVHVVLQNMKMRRFVGEYYSILSKKMVYENDGNIVDLRESVELMNESTRASYCRLLKIKMVLGEDISGYIVPLITYSSACIDDLITFYYVCTGKDVKSVNTLLYKAFSRKDNSLFILNYEEADNFTRYALFNALEDELDERIKNIIIAQISDILGQERIDEQGVELLKMCIVTLLRCKDVDDAVMLFDECRIDEVKDLVRMLVKKNLAERGTCYIKGDDDEEMKYLLSRAL